MTRPLFILFFVFFHIHVSARNMDSVNIVLRKLDSIRHTSSLSSHFAELYYNTTIHAIRYHEKLDSLQKQYMLRLEYRFARLFLIAAEAHASGQHVPDAWQAYYSAKGLNPLYYGLLGTNAHINRDIWKAMTMEFTHDELKKFRKTYAGFRKELKLIFSLEYEKALQQDRRLKVIHSLTRGLPRFIGLMTVYKWRQRQWKLAEYQLTGDPRFQNLERKIKERSGRIDRLIMTNIRE